MYVTRGLRLKRHIADRIQYATLKGIEAYKIAIALGVSERYVTRTRAAMRKSGKLPNPEVIKKSWCGGRRWCSK